MANCPDHARALVDSAAGRTCPFCRGVFVTPAQLVALEPNAETVLSAEARTDSIAFKKRRSCPDCSTVMTPLRIGRLEAWVERCPSCEGTFVETSDARSLAMVARSMKMQDAWGAMDASERSEIAKGLAESEASDSDLPVETLSAGQVAQAAIGLPLLIDLTGAQRPLATILSALALASVFLGGFVLPDTLGFEALAYAPKDDTVLGIFPAVFAHAGWAHFLGNVFALFLFGDAVERRSPRWLVVAALFGVGALSVLVDSWLSSTELIGGASGGVFALLGLTAVLQRKGRWLLPLGLLLGRFSRGGLTAIRVPLPFAMFAYVAFDLFIGANTPGVAWVAHAAGFAIGAVAGRLWERTTS